MKRLENILFRKKFAVGLIVLNILLFLASLWHRSMHVDDAWIGEQAYWLSKIGYVKSELMRGINHQEIRNLVHHKFFTLNGFLFIKMFGFSLWSLKAVSLIWVMIFLFVYSKYLKIKFGTAWVFGIAIFIFHSFVFEFSFVYRPEIVTMSVGFFSFYCIEKFLNHQVKFDSYLVLAGLFAGLAATAHLNGLIFCISGFLLVLSHKKITSAVYFGLTTLPTLMIYFYDIRTKLDFDLWKVQFFKSPAISGESVFSWVGYLHKMLDEHQLFFHSPKEISFSLLFIFSIFILYKARVKINITYLYLIFLVASLSIISLHNTSRYTLLYLPYMVIVIMDAFTYLASHTYSKKYPIAVFSVLLSIFYLTQLTYNVLITMDKFDPQSNRLISQKIIGSETRDKNVIASMEFIFDEIDFYNRVQSDLGFIHQFERKEIESTEEFFQLAQRDSVDYIFVNQHFNNTFQFTKYLENTNNAPYYEIESIDQYMVLKHKD